ncbi:meiosis regulator and mRNA stability factor 1-like isoform X2 [Babylonia areolata]|uniref:meiosis regulator and mRNA stability factor 1-like isoform X2 n=1 Tax=Babylonia areolata TaxID=304850 RepID=UPI003FD493FC
MGDETRKAIGLFWDIENCQVPRYVSALSVVQRLRERFFEGLREAEFMCVCDINKESKNIIEELNNGQVNVVHISATAKNAADDKIRQSLRRFADTHPPETKVVLISGDVNFATDLSDLRHRKHMYVILVHGKQVHEALVSCAHEHYVYDDIMADLPLRVPMKSVQNLQLIVRGYPPTIALDLIRKRLTALSNNCGGRVHPVTREEACITFPTQDALHRAKRRLEGEDVYGQRISVTTAVVDDSVTARLSPSKYKGSSQGDPRSHSRDRRHHSPAPGAPGSSSPVKQFRQNAFTTSYPSHNYGANPSAFSYCSQQSAFQGAGMFPAQQEEGGVYGSSSVLVKRDMATEPPGLTKGKIARTTPLLQRPLFPPGVDGQKGLTSESQVQPFPPPNLSEPPPPLTAYHGAMPPTTGDGVVPGTVNISKTYSFTYQAVQAPPRLLHPQPLYPHQQSGLHSATYNPGPRQSSRFNYNAYNRPRSQGAGGNSSVQQQPNRPYSSRSVSTSDVFDDEDEDSLEAAYFKSQQSGDRDGPVDLTVTNLDYNITKKEWRKILAATFQPQVQVLGICVRTQADNTSIASVRVPCIEDARYAISQFHRRKIGYKRINVTLNDDRDQAPAESTRQETISILSDAKGYTMPVFKFIENYEKRYHKSVSVSDLYKMKDVVDIMDRGGAGRMVRLARGVCPTPSPTPEDFDDPFQEEAMDQPVCLFHCPEGSPQYAEALSIGMLPSVRLQRKHFAAHVHSLLLSHNGVMPLMSFPTCYGAVFGVIPVAEENGVPMEHLISCVPGVEIVVSKKGIKLVHFQENKEAPGAEAICGRTSPMLSQQMALLSREISDLLRQSRTCSIPASKFIPAYHHHFGRQCRVADYGYTKLAELFDALPHVLQVLGTGDRKVLTLSHRAQVKRFITDVVKVLKSQPGKQMLVSDLPTAFERMLFRKFDITHYGVAFIEDMFMDIPPTSIVITMEGNKMNMAIPKRDQTPEEVKRTEQFALELVDLLKHNPQCRMIFNRFIPAYHHHFGRQCRVADYGFTRLTDLFESIPQVVEIVDDEEERMIKLTAPEMRRVLAEQITGLLRESPGMVLPIKDVLLAFHRHYGFPLRLADFGVHDVKSLLTKIRHCVSVDSREDPPVVKLQCGQEWSPLAVRVVQLLMDQSGGCLPLVELCSRYRSMFGVDCDVHTIQEQLLDYVQISTETDEGSALIRLSALQILGRDIRSMLRKVGCVPLPQFSALYQEQFQVELKPALYGFPDLPSLLRAMPHIANITTRYGRKVVQLSPGLGVSTDDEELSQINGVSSSSDDYLSAPVPSAIPSPELQPSQNMNLPDLMTFEQSESGDKVWEIAEDERKGLGTPLCRTPTSDLLHMASPLPPAPREDIFPGGVSVTCPFPPPPPLPTDMAPPPLTEAPVLNPAWSLLMKNAPLPPPPVTSVAEAYTKGSKCVVTASHGEPASMAQLPAACLQWREMLEKGGWTPTPRQLDNLASMGLLGLGHSLAAGNNHTHTHTTSKNHSTLDSDTLARSTSAPAFSHRAGQKQTSPCEPSTVRCQHGQSSGPGSQPQGMVSVARCSTAPVLVSTPYIGAVWARREGERGGGLYSGVTTADHHHSATDRATSSVVMHSVEGGGCRDPDLHGETADLGHSLEESLNLSADGEANVTVVERMADISSPPPQGEGNSQDTSVSSDLTFPQGQGQVMLMTPAGDASTLPSPSLEGRAAQDAAFVPIPPNDSFSLSQPLDTSSTRSAGSGSLGSGSLSDTMSSSPSPRKNPRRARLAANFFKDSKA